MNSNKRVWTALPDMKEGRCDFNPCLFKGNVHMCGLGSQLMEAFSPQKNCFRRLPMQLPESSSCCMFVHNRFLVAHSEHYISKFTAGRVRLLDHYSQVCSQTPASKWSNSQPWVDTLRGLYFFINWGGVSCFDIETGEQALFKLN